MATVVPSRKPSADVIVVGAGVIGLSVAWASTQQGLTALVVDAALPGAASRVAAGLLAPSLGTLPPVAAAAFRRAAAGYPGFLAGVSRSSGIQVAAGQGILEVALVEGPGGEIIAADDPQAQTLTGREVAARAPDLAPAHAGVLHPDDGWIEPGALLASLAAAVPASARIPGRAVRIIATASEIGVQLDNGETIRGGQIVIAAGSWSPLVDGLPSRLPIVPAKGETLVLETTHSLSVAIACEDFYLVPRPGAIVVGATFEWANFDSSTTAAGRARLESFASRIVPGIVARATGSAMWAGLRPMTPDKLPIVDSDPSDGRIVYACGHGKNGLLLAGLTAESVVRLLAGNHQETGSPFGLSRFATG